MKGGGGFFFFSCDWSLATVNGTAMGPEARTSRISAEAPSSTSRALSTTQPSDARAAVISSRETISIFFPSLAISLAPNCGASPPHSCAVSDQYSFGTNAAIARSRSTRMRSATDCTRPADRPRRTLSQSSGLILYPTKRSRIRRACWASTLLASMSRGCSKASRIAFLVISLNRTRWNVASVLPASSSLRCQQIASPSRSGSAARKTDPTSFTAFLSSASVFFFSGSGA